MNIDNVVVINDFSFPKGGASSLALLSARILASKSIRVTFLAGDSFSEVINYPAGIEFKYLGHNSLLASAAHKSLVTGLFNITAERWLSNWITENDTPNTIYHLHGWSQIFSPSIFISLRAVSKRLVISAHDFFLYCPNGSYFNYVSNSLCELIPLSYNCIKCHCDRRSYGHKLWRTTRQFIQNTIIDQLKEVTIITIHSKMYKIFKEGGFQSYDIVHLKNPIENYCGSRVKCEDNTDFIFIGRLEATKDPETAARAAEIAGVPLQIVGQGHLLGALQSKFRHVHFHGFKNPSDIKALMSKSCALVMPSSYPEPFGLVALEALWSGVPVICTSLSFLAPDIESAKAGFTFNAGDYMELSKIMKRIASDSRLRYTLSTNAWNNSSELGCTSNCWMDSLLRIYDRKLL